MEISLNNGQSNTLESVLTDPDQDNHQPEPMPIGDGKKVVTSRSEPTTVKLSSSNLTDVLVSETEEDLLMSNSPSTPEPRLLFQEQTDSLLLLRKSQPTDTD